MKYSLIQIQINGYFSILLAPHAAASIPCLNIKWKVGRLFGCLAEASLSILIIKLCLDSCNDASRLTSGSQIKL